MRIRSVVAERTRTPETVQVSGKGLEWKEFSTPTFEQLDKAKQNLLVTQPAIQNRDSR